MITSVSNFLREFLQAKNLQGYFCPYFKFVLNFPVLEIARKASLFYSLLSIYITKIASC